MKENIGKSFGFLWTTGLGGIFFLLPFVVVCALIGYVLSFVAAVYGPLTESAPKWVPVGTVTGYVILFCVAIAILLLLCFLSGLIARRAIGRKFTKTVEKQLITVFPKYAIYKDLLADNIGGEHNLPSLDPVTIQFDEYRQLAFAADKAADDVIVAYVPGSPDSWNGRLILVSADRVQPIDVPFSEFLGIFERLGRDSAVWLDPHEQRQ
jgi:uncharacterized membrane protein